MRLGRGKQPSTRPWSSNAGTKGVKPGYFPTKSTTEGSGTVFVEQDHSSGNSRD